MRRFRALPVTGRNVIATAHTTAVAADTCVGSDHSPANLVGERWRTGPSERVQEARQRLGFTLVGGSLLSELVDHDARGKIELVEQKGMG
jgi:hypothetical protein